MRPVLKFAVAVLVRKSEAGQPALVALRVELSRQAEDRGEVKEQQAEAGWLPVGGWPVVDQVEEQTVELLSGSEIGRWSVAG